MRLSAQQRRLLGAFLRSCRERLRAADLGMPSRAERRRTPGLRREEVAQLCGLSPTWYSWMEQGRDISVSAPALARLADALRLTAAERSYLFELARQRDPASSKTLAHPEGDPAPLMRAALKAIAGPAYLLDPGWRATAWNAPAGMLFADWFGTEGRCLLDYMFLDPRSRRLVPDWTTRARRLVAEFRADTGRRPEDPGLRGLIDRLAGGSEDFAALWTDHTVLSREGGLRVFDHPTLGALRYEQLTFHPAAWPEHRLVMLVAQQGGSSADIAPQG